MSNNNAPTQSKFKSNNDRAAFKKECVDALAGIAEKYDVSIVFGPLTERFPFGLSDFKYKHGKARMELQILER